MSRPSANAEEGIYLSRRTKLLRRIKGEAALIVSSPETTSSRDQSYDYRYDSDLFYLTGFAEPECALLLLGTSQGPRSVLFLREREPLQETWHGERLGLKRARRRFQVDEIRDIARLKTDLPALLTNTRALHFAPGVNPACDEFIWNLFKTSTGPRLQFPNAIKDVRLITSEMRFVKDRVEIQGLRHAADITARAFLMLLPHLHEVTSEKHAAAMLEGFFSKLGAHGLAFPTIVASGRNAVTLHHTPLLQPLWKRELVLIDAGASFRGYTGDITRTLPVSGKFTGPQADIYDLVHSAREAAVAKSRPEVSLDDIHETAVKQITRGLVDLKILKGNVPELIAQGKYRKFFMHRTSHWLGLDVHDVSPVSYTGQSGATFYLSASMRPLVPGNAFTIEPGLYFDPKDLSIPAAYRGIGVRIEDDILITSSGCEVLSSKLPSKRDDIEALLV